LQVTINDEPRKIEPGTSVAALLAELGRDPRHVAVEVNHELVPRATHGERMLSEGDRLEVVTLVGGG
jgi:thiamine biosynthesis protein ThiS